MVEKFWIASLEEILLATDAFLDESTSDHSDDEHLELALELYSVVADAEVIPYRFPADGTYSYVTIRRMPAIDANMKEKCEILSSLLGLGN